MKSTLCLLLLIITTSAFAQGPPQDPIAENLFSPELVMQNQQAVGLTQEQKDSLKSDLRKAQLQFTELQWRLQDEVEKLVALLKQGQVDETQALAQLDRVLDAEREIKRQQVALLVRIKNKLTAEQQSRLTEIKSKLRAR